MINITKSVIALVTIALSVLLIQGAVAQPMPQSAMSSSDASITNLETAAVARLKLIATDEQNYQTAQADKTYGWLEELMKSDAIEPDAQLGNIVPAYKLLWLMNEDKTKFAVVALPQEKRSDLRIFMVDESMTVKKVWPVRDNVVSSDFQEIMDSEKAMKSKSGKFDWMDMPASTDPASAMILYISKDMTNYFLTGYGTPGSTSMMGAPMSGTSMNGTSMNGQMMMMPEGYFSMTGKLYTWGEMNIATVTTKPGGY